MAEADGLNRAAVRFQQEGRYNEALAAFQKASALFAKLRDRRGEARCLNGAGAVLKDLGRYAEARGWLERALPLRIEVGDLRGELLTRITLGPVYQSLGMNQQSVETLQKALVLAERVGDPGLHGQAFFNLGVVASETGRFLEALDWFKKSLAIATETFNMLETNKCLNSLGVTCTVLARYDEALRYYEETLTLSEQMGNRLAKAAALENSAGLYRRLGDSARAIPLVKEALQILKEENALALISTTASLCGRLMLDVSDLESASQYLGLAIDTARRNGDQAAEANALQHMGAVYERIGRFDDAAASLDKSIRLCRVCGNRYGERGALGGLCVLEAKRGHHDQAAALAEKAIEIARADGDEHEIAVQLYNLAAIHDERGNRKKALELFEASVSAYDALRHRVSGDQWRTSLFDSFEVQQAYYVYISRLLREGADRSDAERAFLVSERRHARALLDMVAERGVDNQAAPSALRNATPWSLQEVQQRSLDNDTLLLEYSLHQDNSYVFAVTKDRFDVFVLPAGSIIHKKVDNVRTLASGESSSQFAQASHDLYNTILGPVAPLLSGRKLLIVPDGGLHVLPFQMLVTEPSGGSGWRNLSFLGQKTSITYTPSATIAGLLRQSLAGRESGPGRFIGFAPLHSSGASARGLRFNAIPQTRAELEKIGGLFGSDAVLLFGAAATKPAVLSRNLDGFRYIHFATHGIVNEAQPEASALALHPERGSDCLLSAAEIMTLRLRADVVGLSACETALGRVRYGEGVIGLARAFLYSGARCVCASLWEVADAATADLMAAYYRNLTGGMQNAAALQAAQIELIKSSKYAAPYYWAPFILVGG
jgi:CHAT domain-containing protein/Tfp pilus assembly protein PilF